MNKLTIVIGFPTALRFPVSVSVRGRHLTGQLPKRAEAAIAAGYRHIGYGGCVRK